MEESETWSPGQLESGFNGCLNLVFHFLAVCQIHLARVNVSTVALDKQIRLGV